MEDSFRNDNQCEKEMNKIIPNDQRLPQIIAIRLLMSGKEVGSIIGKKGDNVKTYREKSGARINISDGSSPERIVTITGTVEQIFVAFIMICQKFEDDCMESLAKSNKNEDITCPPVTLRVLVPAIQCGPIIGKGGSKIKEIRDLTGASIQVASELLPNSSERSVTVSGAAKAVAKCIKTISRILINSPPKGTVIPYRSKPLPQGLPSPATFIFPAASTMPNHSGSMAPAAFLLSPEFQHQMPSQTTSSAPGAISTFNSQHMSMAMQINSPVLHAQSSNPSITTNVTPPSPYMTNHLLSLMANCSAIPFCSESSMNNYSYPSPNSMLQTSTNETNFEESHLSETINYPLQPETTSPSGRLTTSWQKSNESFVYEFVIPNDLIGCIIGRGGAKINEIRQVSKALIKISNSDNGGTRKITISGAPNQISIAKHLISNSIELHKHLLALNTAMCGNNSVNQVTSTSMSPHSLTGIMDGNIFQLFAPSSPEQQLSSSENSFYKMTIPQSPQLSCQGIQNLPFSTKLDGKPKEAAKASNLSSSLNTAMLAALSSSI